MRYGRYLLGEGFSVHAIINGRSLCGRSANWNVRSTKRDVTCKTCLHTLGTKVSIQESQPK